VKTIILLRHGEVDIDNNRKISAYQFKDWINQYNNSNIKHKIPEKDEVKSVLDKADIILASGLKRSSQSIEIFKKTAYKKENIFNEAQIPYTDWTTIRLTPKLWLIIFRTLWFFGYSKNSKSFKETKTLANKAAIRLITLTNQNNYIVLVGHGIMNRLISKVLIKHGWKNRKKSKNKNWAFSIFRL